MTGNTTIIANAIKDMRYCELKDFALSLYDMLPENVEAHSLADTLDDWADCILEEADEASE